MPLKAMVSSRGDNVLPLSTAQLGVWLGQQLNSHNSAYNIGEYIEIHGPIDFGLFERSLRQVVGEAQSLHVRMIAEGPGQVLDDLPSWSLPVF